MANPNPEVYRDPEHWVQCKILSGTQEGVNRPKIIDWCGDNRRRTGTIGSTGAVPNGYLQASEPLDLSICPTGQNPNVSCFSQIWRFSNPQNDAAAATPTEIIERNAPCNWSFGEVDALPSSLFGSIRDKSSQLQRWSPNSANDRGDNTNWNFCPYTTWGMTGSLLQIKVQTIESYTTYSGVQIPDYNSTLISLDEWKNSHSDKPIQGLTFEFHGNTSITPALNFAASWEYADGTSIGVCSIDSCGNYASEPFYDYTRGFFNRACFFPLIAAGLNENYNDVADSLYFYGLDKLQGVNVRAVANPTDNWRIGVVVPYSLDNYNAIMQMAACFAMCFTPTSKTSFAADLNDNDLYIPIIDDDGISNGEYTHGADNSTNPAAQISDIRSVNYDPSAHVDPNTYSNVTGFNSITNNAALTKFYVLDSANVEKLGDDLWTICDGLSAGDFEHFDGKIKDEFLTTNPIDSIIALKRFPFNVPHTFNPNKVPVQLGKSTGTAQGYRTFEVIFGVNFKGVDIFPRFGDCFLDYAPYTKYELYIPFCGTIDINAGDILGHKLNCQLLIDLLTGSCMAYVMADQLVIGTAKGSCGVDMQMSGVQTATMNANIFNGILNAQLAETQHTTAIGKISLNPFKWYENLEVAETRQLQTQHDITHMVVPLHKMGSASPLLSWVQEFNARLMIYYPEGDVITSTIPPDLNAAAVESFGHIKGFATATPGKVSRFQRRGKQCYLSGNIVADSIPCTDNERQRIIAAFNSGVYLPSL